MAHPLDGCRAKLRRAALHIEALKDAVKNYDTQSPFKVESYHYPGTGDFALVVVANDEFQGIPPDIVLIAGEVAYQLRSALDHLVWQLVRANTGNPPTGTKSQFPIFKTEEGYDTRAAQMIAGVSASAADRIRGAQPFHLGEQADRALTWLVHELNNTDKHRVIPVTASYCCVGYVRMRKKDGSVIDIVPPQAEVRPRLTPNSEIARISDIENMENVEIDVSLGFDISFNKVGGEALEPATHLLIEMTDHVTKLIDSFAVEFPKEPKPSTVIVFTAEDFKS